MNGRFTITRFLKRGRKVRDGTNFIIRVWIPVCNLSDVMRFINELYLRVLSKFRSTSNNTRYRINAMRRFLVSNRKRRSTSCLSIIYSWINWFFNRCVFRSLRYFNSGFGFNFRYINLFSKYFCVLFMFLLYRFYSNKSVLYCPGITTSNHTFPSNSTSRGNKINVGGRIIFRCQVANGTFSKVPILIR